MLYSADEVIQQLNAEGHSAKDAVAAIDNLIVEGLDAEQPDNGPTMLNDVDIAIVSDQLTLTAPRKPGRPSVGPRTTIRLSAETYAALDDRAARLGIDRTEAMRRAIAAWLTPTAELFTIDFGAGADLTWLTEPSDIPGNNLHFRPAGRPGLAEIDRDAVEWLLEHRGEDEDGYIDHVDGGYTMYVAGDAYPLIPS